jgi:hypothetical protein
MSRLARARSRFLKVAGDARSDVDATLLSAS